MSFENIPVFNYTTLECSLVAETKTFCIEIQDNCRLNQADFESLFELETVFTWAASRPEIATILLTTATANFGEDDFELSSKIPEERLGKFVKKLQRLSYSLFYLPQTLIIDLKGGAQGFYAELALAADIRFAKNGCKLIFNHLQNGLVPMSGGISFLSALVGKNFARTWVLSGAFIPQTQLQQSGFIFNFYDETFNPNPILTMINQQPPVARIQAKRAFLEDMMQELDRGQEFEERIGKVSIKALDWKEKILADNENRKTQYKTPK
jgi:enoyl-CoA hydratase/carnithine racemase